jgi:hypothetical protein
MVLRQGFQLLAKQKIVNAEALGEQIVRSHDLAGAYVAPSSFVPRAAIMSEPSGNARCNLSASSTGAVIHISISSGVVRMTGIALGWIARTSAL